MQKLKWIALLMGLCLLISGCQSGEKETVQNNEKTEIALDSSEQIRQQEMMKKCRSIFNDVEQEQWKDSLSRTREIVRRLGESGYCAIDTENQVDMTHPEELENVIRFAEKGKNGETVVFCKAAVLCVSPDGGLIQYCFYSEDDVVRYSETDYDYGNGRLSAAKTIRYEACVFNRTEEGYLMIEGHLMGEGDWYAPEEVHFALRLDPLEEQCREWNRRYILPVSYSLNNMFITEWNSDNYGDLDFYDVFERFYGEKNEKDFPYVMNHDLSVGEEYPVPSKELETVVQRHFSITDQELHNRLRYDPDRDCYLFRPRGAYEYDYADIPFPEVVSGNENEDGSLTLLVNAVYPNENNSRLFSHEVMVKETDGEVHYLSNHLLDGEDISRWWHENRYTDQEWEDRYKNQEGSSGEIEE